MDVATMRRRPMSDNRVLLPPSTHSQLRKGIRKMALIKCHECGKDVSTEAKACPSCGAKVVLPKKKSRMGRLFLYALVGVILVGVIQAVVQEENPPKPLTPEESANQKKNEKLAVLAKQCTRAIEASLKFPEGAKIPNPYSAFERDKFYMGESKGRYEVQVTFEARNGFNAMKRSVVECKWKKVGDDFRSLGMKTIE